MTIDEARNTLLRDTDAAASDKAVQALLFLCSQARKAQKYEIFFETEVFNCLDGYYAKGVIEDFEAIKWNG